MRRRFLFTAVFGVAVLSATTPAAPRIALGADKPDSKQGLARAQQYLVTWQEKLSAIVAEERYEQTVRTSIKGVGQTVWKLRSTRRLRSDVLLLRAPADHLWLCFRDVLAVDDTAVPDRQERFDALFNSPLATLMADATRIAAESARFNLGIHRTINTPTAALVFLVEPYARSTSWSLRTGERLGDRRVWVLRFQQHKPPFAIHTFGKKPLRASGRIWLEPDSGRILKTQIVVQALNAPSVITEFAYVPAVDAWAAVRMEETLESMTERVHGVATYSNHRLFRTSARIVGH